MTKDEALRLALEAMDLANSSHDTMLLSDPPKSAWRYHNVDMKLREAITAIKAALEAKDEPVAVWELFEDGWDSIAAPYWMELLPVGTKLYTAPPQRTWVSMTNEQFLEACKIAEGGNYMVAFQRIQQWLMEKNT
jgi:hypothetical protein